MCLLTTCLFPSLLSAGSQPTYTLRLAEGSQATVPAGYKIPRARMLQFAGQDFRALVFSRNFAQGEAGYLELIGPTGMTFSGSVRGRPLQFQKTSFGARALFGIATGDRPGSVALKLNTQHAGRKRSYRFALDLERTRYLTFHSSMDLGRFSNRNYLSGKPKLIAFIRDNAARKAAAYRRRTDLLLDGQWFHPRDRHYVTSPFHARRVTQRYVMHGNQKRILAPRVSHHSGTDLKGKTGEIIRAVARGRVVIARKMHYEGNFIIIDHGHGIFSTYMHQSKLLVKEGDLIAAGTTIGEVGSTGMVTGPHLHISLYIRGVRLDPLSLLVLPIRS